MVYEVKKEMNGNALTITYDGELVATLALNQCITKENVFYHVVSVYADGRTSEEVVTRIHHKAGNSSLYGEDTSKICGNNHLPILSTKYTVKGEEG